MVLLDSSFATPWFGRNETRQACMVNEKLTNIASSSNGYWLITLIGSEGDSC